ncbi:hypothetical protein ACFFHM_11420 [Halalkalibacter kiskunsagensis]|uniref:Polymerase n=1 Tax=Halalkalibacter kiskunsagensis TaxID=1548599 RepID=A0ABV6KCT0_9BACI
MSTDIFNKEINKKQSLDFPLQYNYQLEKFIKVMNVVLLFYLCIYGTIIIYYDGMIFRSLKDVVMLIISLLSIVLIVSRKYMYNDLKVILFFLFYITIFGLIGHLMTGTPLNYIYGFKVTILPLLMLFLGYILRGKSVSDLIILFKFLYVLIISVWVIQYILGIEKLMELGFVYGVNVRNFGQEIPRLPSLVGIPSAYGMLLAVLGIMVERNDKLCQRYVLVRWLVKINTLVFLLLSTQRTSIIFWVVTQICMFVFYIRNSLRQKQLLILSATFLIVPFIVIVIANFDTRLYSTSSFSHRLEHWFIHLPYLFSFEGLLGLGLGAVGAATIRVHQLGYDVSNYYVDNQFFAFYQQGGILGTILWIIFLMLIMYKLISNYLLNEKKSFKNIEVTALSMLIGVFIAGFFTNTLEVFPFNVFFWMFIGIALSINNQKK